MSVSKFKRTVAEPPKHDELATTGRTGAIVGKWSNGLKAIIKVSHKELPDGKTTQRDLPAKTQPFREVAFYQLAQMFGWQDIIPETVLTEYLGRPASAQLYMPASKLTDLQPYLKKDKSDDEKKWITALRLACQRVPTRDWLRLMVLDMVACSRDRHINNVGLRMVISGDGERPLYHPIGWDNSTSFGLTFAKYHNVFHKYLFRHTLNLSRYWKELESFSLSDFQDAIGSTKSAQGKTVPLLSELEVEHAYARLQWMLEYPYRLPWKVCSKGHDDANGFPSYKSWFVPLTPTSRMGRLFVSAGSEPVIVGAQ